MRFDTVIKNGTVVTATDTYKSDVGIAGGRIAAIAESLPAENAGKVIDATGCLVMPGGIDVHTHLDMPFGGTTSADDFESGTIAAAFGGTTTIVDFAVQDYGEGLRQGLAQLRRRHAVRRRRRLSRRSGTSRPSRASRSRSVTPRSRP